MMAYRPRLIFQLLSYRSGFSLGETQDGTATVPLRFEIWKAFKTWKRKEIQGLFRAFFFKHRVLLPSLNLNVPHLHFRNLENTRRVHFIKIARHDMCMCQAATLCNLMQTLLGPKRRRGH